MREFIDGNEAVARGALQAGCNFFAGYPITPATSILLYMLRELPRVGGIAIQAEDEISAMGMCIGAVLTGARALTATSGPGISLYSENIGAAIMSEVPLVIVDCQRMGPATGAATTASQGDIQFLRWGTSGGYPVIVLAPTDVRECYSLTQKAFDLAERFRVPVFLAIDKEIALTKTTVVTEQLENLPVRTRKLAGTNSEHLPYRATRENGVPDMAHFGGPHIVRMTASSHNAEGYIVKDPEIVGSLNQRLDAKIHAHVDEIACVKADLQEGARILILSYGITARSMEAAVLQVRRAGKKISALTIYSLWPIPETQIRDVLKTVKRVIVPELNLGQYSREIQRLGSDEQEVISLGRVDGELITPEQILEKAGLA